MWKTTSHLDDVSVLIKSENFHFANARFGSLCSFKIWYWSNCDGSRKNIVKVRKRSYDTKSNIAGIDFLWLFKTGVGMKRAKE
jgi:hypothetical protein